MQQQLASATATAHAIANANATTTVTATAFAHTLATANATATETSTAEPTAAANSIPIENATKTATAIAHETANATATAHEPENASASTTAPETAHATETATTTAHATRTLSLPATANATATATAKAHATATGHKTAPDFFTKNANAHLRREVEKTLILEPGYGIPIRPNKVPVCSLIKDLEEGVRHINSMKSDNTNIRDEQINVRAKAVNIISNYYKNNKRPWMDEITTNFLTTKRFLKDNPNLIVTRSDKSNNTVLMKKEEYLKEMHKMLQDKNIYQLLNNDPTSRYEKLANNLITKLKKESIIPEDIEKNMKSYISIALKLYGLRKTQTRLGHKTCQFIPKITLQEDYRLVSLDVISLFTNIPKKLVIKMINEDWDKLTNFILIPKNILLEIIKFCFKSSYFKFDGSFYQQLDGSSMGNPASPIVANLFTIEVEDNGTLRFLDVTIIRNEDETISTNWYSINGCAVSDAKFI
ncbi:PREDICTED: uncharacterized protein LOC106792572 [Polistes canadensis]|uniref:uncharacterized protein LOC106792572 n=1 Tax=Polistes canadensis TaxID=91411 RepID=UPI000718E7BA|nr:PREDICTED: uncharacterized protein LOC106792572 [Polistes canadensis]